MSNVDRELMKKARKIYKRIYPVANRKHLAECFTSDAGARYFWFNTSTGSTKVVHTKLPL